MGIFLLGILTAGIHAENPIELGIRGAIKALAPVPVATAANAERTAKKILEPYLRPSQGGFYLYRKGGTGKWIEIRGLKVARTTLGTLSQADRSNGISERIIVSYAASMHREQRSGQSWSEWINGMPGLFPRTIRVEKKNGIWVGSSSHLQFLQACNDQPISIPSTSTRASQP